MPRPSEKEAQQKKDSQYLLDHPSPESAPPEPQAPENQATHAPQNQEAPAPVVQEAHALENQAAPASENQAEDAPQQAPAAVPARRPEPRKQLPTGAHGINTDPLVPALLRVSQLIYRESRPVLYSDNELVLHLPSALCTLSQLHQRSRSLIKHVRLAIPTHHDILEGFADLVRLGLRYCWGLKTFTISLPDMFPEERHVPSTTNVYANAFHILRWLPKHTVVRLEGNVNEDIRKVVEENGRLSGLLSEVSRG